MSGRDAMTSMAHDSEQKMVREMLDEDKYDKVEIKTLL